jgi:hypothetical protein
MNAFTRRVQVVQDGSKLFKGFENRGGVMAIKYFEDRKSGKRRGA